MAQYQTNATSLNMIRGSGKIEVAAYVDGNPDWIDCGAIRGLSVVENVTIATEEYDNAEAQKSVSKQEVTIGFTQLELLNLDAYEIIRGDLDTITQESQTTKIQSGNKTTIPYFMCRITTLNDSNGPVYFTAYKCQINKGLEFSYKTDAGEDRLLENSVELLGRQDSGRGNFVWEIEAPFNG